MSQTSLIIDQRWPIPVEARLTTTDEPGSTAGYYGARDWYVMEIMGADHDRLIVNSSTALTYSVVFACVRYIAQTIASLGWHVYERTEDGRTKKEIEDNIAWTLGMQASPEMSAFDWRQVMLKDALTWGNGYAEIERTRAGQPWWMWRIDPERVELDRTPGGNLIYRVRNNPGMDDTILSPTDVFHLKGMGPDGLVGYSPIALARRSIELGMNEERFGQQFFRKGPMPGGVLKMPGVVKKEERDAMRKSFQEAYGGATNAGKVVVLSGGADFARMDLPNTDAQFIESRSFQIEELCRFYGVPPHKVAKLDRATFSNIEQQSIEAVQDCLLPWCRRLEMEADVKLFGRVSMGRRYTTLNLDTLLRGDTAAQIASVTSRVNTGLMTPNEGRDYFGQNPVDGADELLVQGAMVTLDSIVNPPEPPPAPIPFAPSPDQQQQADNLPAQMPAALAETFGQLFEDAYARLLRTEADKAKTARNRGEIRPWADQYYTPENVTRVAGILRPLVQAFFLAAGRQGNAAEVSARMANEHNQASFAEALAGMGPNGRAPEQAAAHVRLLWQEGRPT